MGGFFEEVKRRKVYQVAVAYVIAAGGIIHYSRGSPSRSFLRGLSISPLKASEPHLTQLRPKRTVAVT